MLRRKHTVSFIPAEAAPELPGAVLWAVVDQVVAPVQVLVVRADQPLAGE